MKLRQLQTVSNQFLFSSATYSCTHDQL